MYAKDFRLVVVLCLALLDGQAKCAGPSAAFPARDVPSAEVVVHTYTPGKDAEDALSHVLAFNDAGK